MGRFGQACFLLKPHLNFTWWLPVSTGIRKSEVKDDPGTWDELRLWEGVIVNKLTSVN